METTILCFAGLSVSKTQNHSNDCDQQEHEDQATVHWSEGKTHLSLNEGEHKLCDSGAPWTVHIWRAVKWQQQLWMKL